MSIRVLLADDYVSRMLTRLGLTDRTQAAILAHEAGLLDHG